MNRSARAVTPEGVRTRTYLSRQMAARAVAIARQYEVDGKRVERLEQGICQACFYLRQNRIGGQAMTNKPCDLCGTLLHSGNTNIDDLCQNCAVTHELCRQCGGDLLMRSGRTFVPPTETATEGTNP